MEEAINKLGALAEKYAHSRKLNFEENGYVRNRLEHLFLAPEYTEQSFGMFPRLPMEAVCPAFMEAWKASDRENRERMIRALLEHPAMENQGGLYRKLALIGQFIEVDKEVALRILVDFSNRLTGGGRKSPASSFVTRFRKELMDTRKLLSIPINGFEVNPREISPIAAMVFFGMLEDREMPEDIPRRTEFLNWLESCRSKVMLDKSLVEKAEKITEKWPVDLQERCFELGLIKTVVRRITPHSTERNALLEYAPGPGSGGGPMESDSVTPLKDASIQIKDGPAPAETGLSSPANCCERLNVRECANRLVQYIGLLEQETDGLKKKADRLEAQYHLEQMRTVELSRELQQLQANRKSLEEELSNLSDQLMIVQRQNEELQERLEWERAARAKEVERLKNQIDLECRYVVDEFKNKLFARLRSYHSDYLEASRREPTEKLASYFIQLLNRIFRELASQGIRFDREGLEGEVFDPPAERS